MKNTLTVVVNLLTVCLFILAVWWSFDRASKSTGHEADNIERVLPLDVGDRLKFAPGDEVALSRGAGNFLWPKASIDVHYDGNMDSGIMLDELGEVAYVVKGKRVTVAEFEVCFKTWARGEK